MASLSSVYITTEKLKEVLSILNQKGEKGINLTISIQDESNEYGQNLSMFVSQSKEDREAGKKKYYLGNGACFWNDGKIQVATKKGSQAPPPQQSEEDDDLPF